MVTEQERELEGTQSIRALYGDLLVHANTVDDLSRGESLASWQRQYLTDYHTNALNDPHITDWEKLVEERSGKSSRVMEVALSPNSFAHVALITATRRAYRGLRWEQLRLLFGGEAGIQVANPQSPIAPEESLGYLAKAQEQDLFHLESQPSKPIAFTVDDPMGMLYAVREYGVMPGGTIIERWEEVRWDSRFSERIHTLAIDKLGCYLAVADQATFNEQAHGNPIRASYKPLDLYDKVFSYYLNKYGRNIPTFGEAYQEAHTVFASLCDPIKNSLTAHLVSQTSLPYLV